MTPENHSLHSLPSICICAFVLHKDKAWSLSKSAGYHAQRPRLSVQITSHFVPMTHSTYGMSRRHRHHPATGFPDVCSRSALSLDFTLNGGSSGAGARAQFQHQFRLNNLTGCQDLPFAQASLNLIHHAVHTPLPGVIHEPCNMQLPVDASSIIYHPRLMFTTCCRGTPQNRVFQPSRSIFLAWQFAAQVPTRKSCHHRASCEDLSSMGRTPRRSLAFEAQSLTHLD